MLYRWIYTSNEERYTIPMCPYEATTGESNTIMDEVIFREAMTNSLDSGRCSSSQLLPASSIDILNITSISSVLNLVIDRMGRF